MVDGQALHLTAFRAAVDASFVPLEVTSPSPDDFRGKLASRTVAGVPSPRCAPRRRPCAALPFRHPLRTAGADDRRAVGSDAGLGRIVSPFHSQLVAGLDDLSGPTGTRLVHNTVDLLQTLLTNELDVTRTAASPHWALLQQIRDHIDEHLGSPGLYPSSIATANFISTRRLHNVFLEQGMTVSAYVRSRRLECCHQDLVDPAQRYTPVAVIGARSGFTDAAHFSLTFKAAHTESPAALRRRGRGDG